VSIEAQLQDPLGCRAFEKACQRGKITQDKASPCSPGPWWIYSHVEVGVVLGPVVQLVSLDI
jgi:hypothetical protein